MADPTVLEVILKEVQEVKALLIAQNGRIRALERWRAYVIGISVGTSGLLLFVVDRIGFLKG